MELIYLASENNNLNKYRWSRKRLLSYGAFMNFAVGARAIGKSFQAKDWAINLYINKGHTTKWIMRYKTEIDKAVNDANFFGTYLIEKYNEKGYQFIVDNDGCFTRMYDGDIKDKPPTAPEWEKFITFSTMSERSIKAAEDPDCALIVYDEFIPLPGTPYVKDEVTRFLEYVFTVIRTRNNARVLLLSNNITIISPYFSFFKIKLPKKGEIFFDKERSIAIENCKNESFAEEVKKTSFGRLVAGTEYAGYAIENETMIDLHTFVSKRPLNARAMVKILTTNGTLYLYVIPPGHLCIARNGSDNLPEWSVDEYTHYEKSTYIGYAGSLAKNLIKRNYENATLFFDDEEAKAIFMASCINLIK